MKKILTIKEIQDTIVPIAKMYAIDEIYLFGSYATGNAHEYSDIDLIIDADNETNDMIQKFKKKIILQFFKKYRRRVDIITLDQVLASFFLPNVLIKDGIKIYQRSGFTQSLLQDKEVYYYGKYS